MLWVMSLSPVGGLRPPSPRLRRRRRHRSAALAQLKKEGKIGFVGFSGLPLKIFRHILDRVPAGAVDVVLSYCHYHLLDTSLTSLLPYLKEKGVAVINASPLAMGLFTPQGPPAWHPAPAEVQRLCGEAVKHCTSAGEKKLFCAMGALGIHGASAILLRRRALISQKKSITHSAVSACRRGPVRVGDQVRPSEPGNTHNPRGNVHARAGVL